MNGKAYNSGDETNLIHNGFTRTDDLCIACISTESRRFDCPAIDAGEQRGPGESVPEPLGQSPRRPAPG